MNENEKSKIRTNGRPKMEVTERKSTSIQIRVNESERAIFQNLHKRFSPHLSEAEFARTKILDDNIVLFGIRDLANEEKELLKEIALLGNQFKMVASRKNITLTQERQFKEDAQKVREILDSSHRKVLEYQKNELHYFKIGVIVEKFKTLLAQSRENEDTEPLINEIELIYESLNTIYQSIIMYKR